MREIDDELLDDMLTEVAALRRELGDTHVPAEATGFRTVTVVSLGRLEAARREIEHVRATHEHGAQPYLQHTANQFAAALALGDGRLAEAEALAQRSHEWGQLLTGQDASAVYGIQMFSIRREQGRLTELATLVRVLAGQPHSAGPWRPGMVALLAELGMQHEAQRELSQLAAEGLDRFRESLWLASLVYLTDACALLGNRDMAALVYPELVPLAGKTVVIGHLVAFYGAADRYLGMLAAALGDDTRAEEHFQRGLALDRRMGADTWVAHTAAEYGRFLLLRDRTHEAEPLLTEAAALADRIGMRTLAALIAALPRTRAATDLPDGLSPREAQILRLLTRGLSNREVGAELHISEHTAANHVRNILQKTGCANRTEAASYAYQHQLVAD